MLGEAARKHGLIVWFDPAKQYSQFVASLGDSLDDIPVLPHTGSHLALRRAIEPFVGLKQADDAWRDAPGAVLVYLPLDQAQTDDALSDLTAIGTVFAPKETGSRNTGL